MSLYIGKDDLSNNILSVSKTTASINELKNPVSLSNIAFHSKYPMLGVYSDEIYSTTTISSYSAYNNTWVRKLINIPANIVSAIANEGDRRVVIFYRTGSSNPITVFNPVDVSNITDTVDVLRYTGGNYYITTTNSVSTIRVVVLDYTVSGNYVGSTLFNKSINITSSQLLMNGEDYFRKKFLVTPSVNTVDSSIVVAGEVFQVLNSVTSSSGLELVSNSLGTTISLGGKAVFNSAGNYKQIFGVTPVVPGFKTFTIPTGFDTISTLATGLPSGSEIVSISLTANSLYPDSVVSLLMSGNNSVWIPVLLGFFPTMPDGQPGNYITYLRLYLGNLQSKSEITAMGGDSVAGSVGVINGYVTYAVVSG